MVARLGASPMPVGWGAMVCRPREKGGERPIIRRECLRRRKDFHGAGPGIDCAVIVKQRPRLQVSVL